MCLRPGLISSVGSVPVQTGRRSSPTPISPAGCTPISENVRRRRPLRLAKSAERNIGRRRKTARISRTDGTVFAARFILPSEWGYRQICFALPSESVFRQRAKIRIAPAFSSVPAKESLSVLRIRFFPAAQITGFGKRSCFLGKGRPFRSDLKKCEII